MVTYLLHFSRPYKHARHYVGVARDLEARLEHHANGTGARLMQVVAAAGITFELARVWLGEGRTFERKLKRTKSVRDYCPVCAGEKVRAYKPKTNSCATRVAPRLAPPDPDLTPTF